MRFIVEPEGQSRLVYSPDLTIEREEAIRRLQAARDAIEDELTRRRHEGLKLPAGYRLLRTGDHYEAGDLAWTWTTPDCRELGWLPIESRGLTARPIVDRHHVPIATKRPFSPRRG